MKRIKLFLTSLVTGVCCWACGDFFEESSQNQAYVSSNVDLYELLVGEVYINEEGLNAYDLCADNNRVMLQTNRYFPWIHVMDDDLTEFALGYHSSSSNWVRENAASAYRWQPNPFVNREGTEYEPDDWVKMYERIAVLNSILSVVDDYRTDPDTLSNRVEGEAAFLRAYYYYWLVNIHAQPYSLVTASTDLGVPLKTSEEVEDEYFARASVQEVYDQIVEDLERSIEAFQTEEKPLRPIKANYTSACILMSRVCLYMEDYERAIAYADSAIRRAEYSILDLNGMTPGDNFTYEDSPETVFTQGGYIVGQILMNDTAGYRTGIAITSGYQVSDDLLGCYDEHDLRRDIFFVDTYFKNGVRCLKYRNPMGRIGDYMLFRYPELYLNKAEALALLGRDAEAKETLNVLREKRFESGQMPSIEDEMAESGEDLVNFIRTERRREFCFEGQRWFDLRRYAVNAAAPFSKTIRHEVREWQGNEENGFYTTVGYYELKPYAEDRAAYAMPLPSDEIIFNKGELVQNELRPERSLVRY